jgi:hypothetical protein
MHYRHTPARDTSDFAKVFRLQTTGLDIEVEISQAFLQSSLFQKIIDGAPLAEVGLRDFDRGFSLFGVTRDKIFVNIQLLFTGAHLFTPGMGRWRPL